MKRGIEIETTQTIDDVIVKTIKRLNAETPHWQEGYGNEMLSKLQLPRRIPVEPVEGTVHSINEVYVLTEMGEEGWKIETFVEYEKDFKRERLAEVKREILYEERNIKRELMEQNHSAQVMRIINQHKQTMGSSEENAGEIVDGSPSDAVKVTTRTEERNIGPRISYRMNSRVVYPTDMRLPKDRNPLIPASIVMPEYFQAASFGERVLFILTEKNGGLLNTDVEREVHFRRKMISGEGRSYDDLEENAWKLVKEHHDQFLTRLTRLYGRQTGKESLTVHLD